MRSPQIHGEEGEGGTSTRQDTPLVGPTLTGGLAALATPELFGPRNCAQFWLEAAAPNRSITLQLTKAAQVTRDKNRICIKTDEERKQKSRSDTSFGPDRGQRPSCLKSKEWVVG